MDTLKDLASVIALHGFTGVSSDSNRTKKANTDHI